MHSPSAPVFDSRSLAISGQKSANLKRCCVYLLLGVMKSSPALQDAGVGDADAAEQGAPTWMREDARDSKSPARLTRRE